MQRNRQSKMTDAHGNQLSPCIVSKAKQAMGLSAVKGKINAKKCTPQYWRKVVRVVGAIFFQPQPVIEHAIDAWAEYCL